MNDTWLFGNRCDRRCGSQGNRWSALDPKSYHPLSNEDVKQEADQINKVIQESYEQIIIKDSADVEVVTTDTKAAVSLQAAIQAAIVLVLSISIADSSRAERIAQELVQSSKTVQVNRQQTYIENSRGVRVTTTDTDLVVNIQLLIQILVALIARLDIL
ncbi:MULTISPECIES: spore coat protein [Bacillus]|uniref:spore coat protein n=1 Tax=Bacillus TaxID=1386 RepID=UPI000BB8C3EF|nr:MULTISPECIES: spore coat protein [Bacillus]